MPESYFVCAIQTGEAIFYLGIGQRRLCMRYKDPEDQEIQHQCEIAINYLHKSVQVIQNLLDLTENLDGFSPAYIMEDPYLQCIQRMLSTFEEMLQKMGVIYRCINAFE